MKSGLGMKSIAIMLTLLSVVTVYAANYGAAVRGVSKKVSPKVVSGVKELYRSLNSEEVKNWRRLHSDVWIPCVECWLGKVACPVCNGLGQILSYDMFGYPMWRWCQMCGATGKVSCPKCGGNGRVILIKAPLSY